MRVCFVFVTVVMSLSSHERCYVRPVISDIFYFCHDAGGSLRINLAIFYLGTSFMSFFPCGEVNIVPHTIARTKKAHRRDYFTILVINYLPINKNIRVY